MNVRPDPSIAVGTPVLAASSKLGTAVDVAVGREAGARGARLRRRQQRLDRRLPVARLAARSRCGSCSSATSSGGPAATRSRGCSRACASASTSTLCIVNGENVANGVGITPRLAERLLAAGADALTLGNHAWRREEIGPYLASSGTVVRPANFQAAAPGRGLTVVEARDGTRGRGDQPARIALPRPRAQHVGGRRRARRGGARARRRSSSSTCTRRRRARRWRSRRGSTAG